jgi:hypothetical protein
VTGYTGTKRAKSAEVSRRLDPIEVAACVEIKVLITIVVQFYSSIAKILNGNNEFWEDRIAGTMNPTTVFAHHQSMMDLAAWKVICMGNPSNRDEARLYLYYLEVEKVKSCDCQLQDAERVLWSTNPVLSGINRRRRTRRNLVIAGGALVL